MKSTGVLNLVIGLTGVKEIHGARLSYMSLARAAASLPSSVSPAFFLLAAAAPLPHPTRSRRRRSTSPPPYTATAGLRCRSTPSLHARAAALRRPRAFCAAPRAQPPPRRAAAACAPPLPPPAHSSTSPHPSQANQATSPTQRKFAARETLLAHPRLARQVFGVLPEPSRSP